MGHLSLLHRSFPSRVDACAESHASKNGGRGRLASIANWSCYKFSDLTRWTWWELTPPPADRIPGHHIQPQLLQWDNGFQRTPIRLPMEVT